MSDTDSFIEEVTEEVRRDRLFILLKRWGWIGGLAVVLLIGGAAFNEYRKATAQRSAEAFGDALLDGIAAEDQGVSLSEIPTSNPEQQALANLMAGADALASGDTETGRSLLDGVANNSDAPDVYRDLAEFKAALAQSPENPTEERLATFREIADSNSPFRLLAREQVALVLIDAGRREEAMDLLREMLDEAGVTAGLQQRATELIVALGGDLGG
ncbi:hypothetical protein [Litoreibacter roseus]|uniref:Tetratricopeptide repeat-like domain-containing protein n=1 Tax=Litoreibacter roseus TaxID=2601869 RepID=A0A6N6JCX5_9RHOB|nr:hypothetical protein [Litoreibacter roseus]GFE64005.1 hypothetical protein KIN_10790 [Litoreibacter roseus]